MSFDEFGLDKQLLEAIHYMGFEKPTEVQERVIPEILEGKDLIACAQTGTGKTAAFILPILHMISKQKTHSTDTLVIVPTRELAIQIDQQIEALGYFAEIHSFAVYGGGEGLDWTQQKAALSTGADIIVATPGKLISHLNMGYVNFDDLKYLVLDEADRMLDMGFIDDIKKITSYLPKKRQTLLFSATMPPKIRKLAKVILKDPIEISLALSKPAEGILQAAYVCFEDQKNSLIHSLISGKPSYKSILVFTSTKRKVFEIVRSLKQNGHEAEGISSDLDQKEREEVLAGFKSRKVRILIATNVIARGIDIKDIDLVINYDVPHDAEDYVHRVGRTARADATGLALTFITKDDMYKFRRIEKLIDTKLMILPLPHGFKVDSNPKLHDRKKKNYSKSRSKGPSNKGKFRPKKGRKNF